MKQTTIKVYQDMTTDEFIELLQNLEGSRTSIIDIAVNEKFVYGCGKLQLIRRFYTIKTEEKQ